jgi:glutaredoxin
MPAQVELVLITRKGCHLCEAAEADLARVIAGFTALNPDKPYTVEVMDVDSDPELRQRFSEEVPVLLLNGEQVAFFRIDVERVLEKLGSL